MSVHDKADIVRSANQTASLKLDERTYDVVLEQQSRDRARLDRRSRIETLFDVLCVIGNGVEKPTHVMYKANLSWSVMQQYIEALLKKSLIVAETTEGKKRYKVSQRGRQVIQQYLSIKEDLNMVSET